MNKKSEQFLVKTCSGLALSDHMEDVVQTPEDAEAATEHDDTHGRRTHLVEPDPGIEVVLDEVRRYRKEATHLLADGMHVSFLSSRYSTSADLGVVPGTAGGLLPSCTLRPFDRPGRRSSRSRCPRRRQCSGSRTVPRGCASCHHRRR